MKKYGALLITVLLFSCSTLNKSALKVKTHTLTNLEQSSQLIQSANRITVTKDSNNVVEELIFWPKGIVKYSSANGFEGELFKMSLSKRDQHYISQQEMQQNMGLAKQSVNVKQEDKNFTKSEFKKKKRTSFYGVISGCAVFLLVMLYFYYKRKLRWLK